MNIFKCLKELYWKNKILSEGSKEKLFYFIKGKIKGKISGDVDNNRKKIYLDYIGQILDVQKLNNEFSKKYPKKISKKNNTQFNDKKLKLLAYYLPQYHPDKHNNEWWGKGSTEWTNVAKAMPQYLGQYQPRLPGELGYYDLRVQENIYRQIELAEIYGIYGFCFYYYWFDGVRLLDLPFNNFVNDKSITFPFCICWVNESWTKQWSGNSNTPLIEISKNVNTYKHFIESCCTLFKKENYIEIDGKPLLIIYKPFDIPNREEVIDYWRNYIKEKINKDLYIIAAINTFGIIEHNSIISGFDALSEFAPGPQIKYMKDITNTKDYVCKTFYGKVYDYAEFVGKKNYFNIKGDKLYRAVCPMWDNTARKMNKGMVLDGSTPSLYKEWLKDVIIETKNNKNLDDSIIFINAWNEWAEGAYLEPDLKWKYGYLDATKDAIIESRKNKE